MMKKLFLMSAVGVLGTLSAVAQSSSKEKGVFLQSENNALQSSSIITSFTNPVIEVEEPSGKTTVGGSRWYSYAEHISLLGVPIVDSTQIPYIWNKGDGMAIYGDGSGGVVADTIELSSYGITFDPAFKSSTTSTVLQGFNDPAAYGKGNIVVTRAKPYVVDTVRVFTTYGRNNLKTSFVDTLRVTLVYGNGSGGGDMPRLGWRATLPTDFPKPQFGYDSMFFYALKYDKLNTTAKGTTKLTKDLYLRNTDTSSSIKGYDIPVNFSVPAGNIVGISVTFVTGHPYTPYVDTIFYSTTINPTNPFNMGMMRPRFFAEAPTPTTKSAASYPEYHPDYYNIGFVKFLPDGASWDTLYVPSLAYTAPFSLEIPDIDVKVTCATCNTIAELSILEETIYSEVNAYPNPANTEINIPFVLKEKANVVIKISNMMGQVIATRNMGVVNEGQEATATFNTSTLSSGVYLYSITANGQTVSNRFTILK